MTDPMDRDVFTLCRTLWHYIWQTEPLFLVTTAYTDRQKTERAFSAGLLAPADGIKDLLETSPDAAIQDDLDKLAQHFRDSPMVIKHQVENQLLSPAFYAAIGRSETVMRLSMCTSFRQGANLCSHMVAIA
ncbi:hypothetical protein [Streptosporangium sp. KLBMP 9127]|nr:hypothetical protein [Streptosporangium sp. KLBMP 9127]